MKRSVVLFVILLISLVHGGAEQRHLESGHFIVSYPAEIEDSARLALEIAEETAETLVPFFGYNFSGKKIVINVCDESDFSNGFARRLQRYVGIDIRKTEIPWRGDTPWLRNVIAHELSHKYTLDIVKRPIYVYATGDVRIDDEGIEGGGSSLLEHNRIPNWFVEALAQVGSYKFGGDRPDPYREMLLRDAFLHGRLLSLDDMARFERSSRDGELVYNQGFYFFLFLLDHEPRQKMVQFLALIRNYGLEKTVEKAYGMTLEELYHEWVESLAVRFSRYSKDRDTLETLYPEKQYPFVAEIACTNDGRYVIANWGNDYADFSLFEKTRSYRRFADDVGTVLKVDPVSGAVWFNALVYDPKNDWEHFELFRSVGSGRPKQILAGTRTRAFDIYDDTLTLASYQAGVTRIERYDLNSGERRVLHELPPGTAVYSLSLIEGADLLVTAGDGKRIHLFRSIQGQPGELWPEIDADILDAVYVGDSRIVFSSTLDGTPQLYAAELSGKVEDWQKLTEVPGGALRPVVTKAESGEMTIICSVYEDGSFKLKRFTMDVESEAATASGPTGLDGRSGAFPEFEDTDALLVGTDSLKKFGENLSAWERSGISPFVPAYPIWTLSYGIDDDEFDFERTYVHTLSAGTILYFSNASDTIELEAQGGLEYCFGKEEIDNLNPYLGLELEADLFRGTLNQELDYWTYSYFADDPFHDEYWVNRLALLRTGTVYEFPLARYCDLAFGYSYYHQHLKQFYNVKGSGMSSVEVWNEPVFGQHEASVRLSRPKWDSTYDPAYLGHAGSLLQFSVTGILNRYYDLDLRFNYIDPKYDPATAIELACRMLGRLVSPKRRVSLTGQLRGIGYLQTEFPEDYLNYLYLSLGRQGYATGYDYIYPVVYFAQGELDLRFNPFHNPFDSVRWYERFSFGVRAEGGIAFTLDSGDLETGYPLSLELALRGGILVTPKREAYLFCKVAFPLFDEEFFGTTWPYRIYFGFTL